MNTTAADAGRAGPGADMLAINDCWNRIGVLGDGSCPRLAEHIHCRNCPVHAAAALRILDRPRPEASEAEARALAQRMSAARALRQQDAGRSVFLFRVGLEWLGLPTTALDEVTDLRRVHSLPHRRNGVVMGLANVRGELLVCVSLREQLGIEPAPEIHAINRRWMAHKRLLVLRQGSQRLVCPVDEVHGDERFAEDAPRPVPSTLARASASYARAVLSWEGHVVGLLDEELLFNALQRSLA